MIPIELIKKFASEDETRYAITQPRVIGGNLVATNGRILVEVPVDECDPAELAAPEIPDADFPDYLPILESHEPDDLIPVQLPNIPSRPEKEECGDCDGTGIFDCFTCGHKSKCENCDGTGTDERLFEWQIQTPVGRFLCQYIEMANTLPGVQFYAPKSEGQALWFTFGERGRGCLMPMRAEGGAE